MFFVLNNRYVGRDSQPFANFFDLTAEYFACFAQRTSNATVLK